MEMTDKDPPPPTPVLESPLEKKCRQAVSLSSALNNASVFAVATAALYYFGWSYFSAFYGYFRIDMDFINTDFTTILTKAWAGIALIIFIMFNIIGDHAMHAINEGRLARFSLDSFAIFLFCAFVIWYAMSVTKYSNITIISIGALLIVFLILGYSVKSIGIFLTKKWEIGLLFEQNRVLFLIAVYLIFSLLVLLQTFSGLHAAQTYCETKKTRIDLAFGNNEMNMTNMLMITHSNSKYFLCEPGDSNKPPNVIVIDDAAVKSARIYMAENKSKTNINPAELTLFITNKNDSVMQNTATNTATNASQQVK